MIVVLLAGVWLAWLLQKWIYRQYWDRRLGVRVEFTDRSVFEGEDSCLREEITNGKKLPLPALEVRLSMSRALRFSGEALSNSNVTDESYRRDMFALFADQKVIRRLTFVCEKRGFYRISKADLVGYDFFMESRYYKEQELHTEMYVYPRPVDTGRIRLLCSAVSGMVLVQNRLYPDPFEFAGIREYRPSDPRNHINWKASARSSELMVNQFDSTTNIRACILLDVEDPGILKYEALTEEGIRIAASLTAALSRKQMELEFVCNGVSVLPDEEEDGVSGQGETQGDAFGAREPRGISSDTPQKYQGVTSGVQGLRGVMSGARMSDAMGALESRDALSGKLREKSATSGASVLRMHLKPGGGKLQEFYRRIACLDTAQVPDRIAPMLAGSHPTVDSGYIQVLISHNQDPETVDAVRRAAARGTRVMWVLPVSHEAVRTVEELRGVTIIPWEVE